MTPQRKAKILASLEAGNHIFRSWKGGYRSGYLSHNLKNISNLRESEVKELCKEIKLEPVKTKPFGPFCSLQLATKTNKGAL